MRKNLARAAALIACAATASVDAMTYVMPTDAALVDQADGVVVVEVLGEVPSPLADQAVYAVRTQRTLTNVPAGAYERVMVPASGARDGLGSWTPGAVRIETGQQVMIAFERRADGILLPLHLSLGVFHRVGDGNDAWYVRELDTNGERAKRNGEYHLARDASRFEAWIAARARGVQRAPDYLIERSLPAPRPKFNLTMSGGKPIRWNAFDSATTVQWESLASGQTGMVADEATMLQQALAAWTNEPNSSILLGYLGTRVNIDTHCNDINSDGHVVLWSDPLGTIGGTFSCNSGGTLANAGPCFFDGGGAFNTAFEARMTVQDGSECFFDGNGGSNGAEVLTHEIGHTLGFAHSCESGQCIDGSSADEAVMRWSAHGDGRGAQLATDDASAAFALYPAAGGADPDVVFRNGFE